MKYGEFEVKLKDGATLFAREWVPEREVRGVVCFVHGLGEHSGRYIDMAMALNQAGYVLMSYDQRGHGKSSGQRGHTPSYETLLDDIDWFRQEGLKRFPNIPFFLHGYSLGGNLVLNYCLRRQPKVNGAILTGPWLRLSVEPSVFVRWFSLFMNKWWPSFSLSSGINANDLFHDSSLINAYNQDPLVHHRITVRLYTTVDQAGLWAIDNAAQFGLPMPILLMHGGGDRITSVEATSNFAAKIKKNCTLKIWPGLYHELHNEPERAEIMAYTINWLDSLTS